MKPASMMKEGGLIAVIVGIDGYKDRTFKPLHCAVNDAVYITEALQKVWHGHKTRLETLIWPSLNEVKAKKQKETYGINLPEDASEVNGNGILSRVRKCAGLAGESDTFVFYFSGHGALTDQEPALIVIGDGKTAEGIEYIKIRDIQHAAVECASRKKIMILDCCQNLTGKDKTVKGYKNLEEMTQGWSILLSSSPGEVSIEDQYFGDSRDDYLLQGIFTASLVEGLRGEAAGSGGSVTLAELAYFVGKRVPIEFQERLESIVLKSGRQIDARGIGLTSQNPVLLTDAVAIGGPYQVIMAPEYVPTSQSARRKMPGKNFITHWFNFLTGKWPILFPYKLGFRFAALLYAATVTLTLLWHNLKPIDNNMLIFFIVVGVVSAFIWWFTLPFAAAANENRWYPGGFITAIFYALWHIIVALGFIWICGVEPGANQEPSRLVYLITDLFLIFAGVVIYGCNTSQTIIALAETIRMDGRRETRQAIRAFQQFKYKMLGVDLYNYMPMVSIRPDIYLYMWLGSMAIIIFNIYQVMIAGEVEIRGLLIFITRNVFALMLITWLVFWYQSAFKFIQREVYKR